MNSSYSIVTTYKVGDFFKNQVSQINTELPLFSLKTRLQHCGKKFLLKIHLIVIFLLTLYWFQRERFVQKILKEQIENNATFCYL